jgi:hypothetical protein
VSGLECERGLRVAQWIYFLHPPRENFAATMTHDERAAWQRHFEWLRELLRGRLVLAGPTGGAINTGIARRTKSQLGGLFRRIP